MSLDIIKIKFVSLSMKKETETSVTAVEIDEKSNVKAAVTISSIFSRDDWSHWAYIVMIMMKCYVFITVITPGRPLATD